MHTSVDLTEVCRALGRYDSPTVSNVVELFGVRPRNAGYMSAEIRALFPGLPPAVGVASTATFRSGAAVTRGEPHTNVVNQVEAMSELPAPRFVVFEDLDQPARAATFGEVMCAIYRRFGCAGIITSGAGRDLQAIGKLGFAAFSSSVCVSHGYGRVEDIHRPVHVGGLTVRPGDLIHADANGVVVIPLEIAAGVAEACPLYIDAERLVLDYLEGETVTVAGLRQAHDQLVARLKSLTDALTARAAAGIAAKIQEVTV